MAQVAHMARATCAMLFKTKKGCIKYNPFYIVRQCLFNIEWQVNPEGNITPRIINPVSRIFLR